MHLYRSLRRFVPLNQRTLAQCLDQGRDNFALLRLVAAGCVIFGHSYTLLGMTNDPTFPWLGVYTHFLGLATFFTISGFLVTLSWQRRPKLWRFLWSRALRILPALLVCVTLSAFLLGPMLTTLPLMDYLRSPQPYAYLIGNASLLDLHWQLPGVFAKSPVTDFVNGSLWTLPIEASLYIVVAMLGISSLLKRRWLGSFTIVVLTIAYLAWPQQPLSQIGLERAIVCFFIFGALCCINREHIPISTVGVLFIVVLTWALRNTDLYRASLALCIAYSGFWFAYVPRLPSIDRIGDGSYGLYLWGSPLQQVLITAGGIHTPGLLFCACLPLALGFGLASWHSIEKLALRLKQPRHLQRAGARTTVTASFNPD